MSTSICVNEYVQCFMCMRNCATPPLRCQNGNASERSSEIVILGLKTRQKMSVLDLRCVERVSGSYLQSSLRLSRTLRLRLSTVLQLLFFKSAKAKMPSCLQDYRCWSLEGVPSLLHALGTLLHKTEVQIISTFFICILEIVWDVCRAHWFKRNPQKRRKEKWNFEPTSPFHLFRVNEYQCS
jgi:hypothetical protein